MVTNEEPIQTPHMQNIYNILKYIKQSKTWIKSWKAYQKVSKVLVKPMLIAHVDTSL